MYTYMFGKNVISHVTNLVSITSCLFNFTKEMLYFVFSCLVNTGITTLYVKLLPKIQGWKQLSDN